MKRENLSRYLLIGLGFLLMWSAPHLPNLVFMQSDKVACGGSSIIQFFSGFMLVVMQSFYTSE